MEPTPPNYRREFFRSPQHVWLALLTLGAGFVSASALGLIIGATAYVIGWIYLPDLASFRAAVDRRLEASRQAGMLARVAEFAARRQTILATLSGPRQERYHLLAEVCRGIEQASADGLAAAAEPIHDPRLRRLDELMWTFLRLLSIEESLERFLETEQQEDLPRLTQGAEQEAASLAAEVNAADPKDNRTGRENRRRLFESRRERLEVLRKRLERVEQARENLALVVSEQERLDQQIKLIRADAVASRNAANLTARIDATVEQLDHTNKWLAEMDQFKDIVGDLPESEIRVGFGAAAPAVIEPPPLPGEVRERRGAKARVSPSRNN